MPTAAARSAPSIWRPACTSHFSIVDRDGNMAAVTQDLAVQFWLQIRDAAKRHHDEQRHHVVRSDTRRPNSLQAGKRCLTNYTPVVAAHRRRQAAWDRRLRRRRIMPAVIQLLSFAMDYGMDLDAAIHQPRIDAAKAMS